MTDHDRISHPSPSIQAELAPISDEMVERAAAAIQDEGPIGCCSIEDEKAKDLARTAIQAALSAAPKGDGWQPIETAPKDGTPVLCFRQDDRFSPVTGLDVLWFEPAIKRWLYNGEPVWNPPTYWIPLPAAPKGGK